MKVRIERWGGPARRWCRRPARIPGSAKAATATDVVYLALRATLSSLARLLEGDVQDACSLTLDPDRQASRRRPDQGFRASTLLRASHENPSRVRHSLSSGTSTKIPRSRPSLGQTAGTVAGTRSTSAPWHGCRTGSPLRRGWSVGGAITPSPRSYAPRLRGFGAPPQPRHLGQLRPDLHLFFVSEPTSASAKPARHRSTNPWAAFGRSRRQPFGRDPTTFAASIRSTTPVSPSRRSGTVATSQDRRDFGGSSRLPPSPVPLLR
jgi:hypothetical protein